ncbi:MAG: GNAT family N-acetyltransferase [Bacilli bacterium]|nr:GNAT family N-acetyltransferase [Bacilli bacterium]
MIIEYEDKYLEDVRDLMVELEEYILSIDEDHLDQLHPDYRVKMTEYALKEAKENEGICYLAIKEDKAIGLIIGRIRPYEPQDYLDYTCPKTGEVTELIISKHIRGKGLGDKLMKKMERYFQEKGCTYMGIDVFAYNENAIHFYEKEGYHNRMHHVIKKLEE